MKKIIVFFLLVSVLFSCSKDDTEAAADQVTISEITNITDITATLSGNAQMATGITITAKGFVWELAPNPVLEFSKNTNEGSGSGSFSSNITNLSRNTEYFVRAYITTSDGTTYSEERSFTTTNECPNGIYRGNVTLLNQDMVDEFGSFQYCEIEGRLRISSSSNLPTITDLSPLHSITKVSSLHVDDNNELTTLNGLNILEIRGFLIIFNDKLTNIDALHTISSPLEFMVISNNETLQNLDGLSGLTELDAEVLAMELQSNPSLTNINGLSNITSIRGMVQIGFNDALQNLDGLENVLSFNGPLEIYFNNSLTNINGLHNIEHLQNIFLSNNLELKNLDGLQSLRIVDKSVSLFSNKSITSINGLSSLETVGEWFSILFSEDLQSLDGLENLVTVKYLDISGNDTLADFCALENLIINGDAIEEYTVQGNFYNPTQQDIIDGNCSQ